MSSSTLETPSSTALSWQQFGSLNSLGGSGLGQRMKYFGVTWQFGSLNSLNSLKTCIVNGKRCRSTKRGGMEHNPRMVERSRGRTTQRSPPSCPRTTSMSGQGMVRQWTVTTSWRGYISLRLCCTIISLHRHPCWLQRFVCRVFSLLLMDNSCEKGEDQLADEAAAGSRAGLQQGN
jgi:hypothetical protein